MVVFETIFGISMILNFMVEYYPDGSTIPMRNMKKIGMRYIKSQFLFDFIPLIPIPSLISLESSMERHFYFIKIIRLAKCERFLNISQFLTLIKDYRKVQTEKAIKDCPCKGNSMTANLINITQMIMMGQLASIIRITIIIVNICYFLGFLVIIFCSVCQVFQ